MTKSKSLAGLARLAWIATAFALVVIVFGAFVRLSYAGLSCPDWPTCYGQITWPAHANEIASANAAFPDRMVDTTRAWREQVHRFLAGGLILTTFALAFWAWRRRTDLATLRFGGLAKVLLAASAFILFQALLGMWTVTWKLKPIVVMGHLAFAVIQRALRYAPTRAYAIAIALALVAQIGLGIANVRLGLPLPIATAHNGMAALLLLTLLALLVRVRREI